MTYLSTQFTVGRWYLYTLVICAFLLGYSVGAIFTLETSPSSYIEGYADGRSQAHQDVMDYARYRREKEE